MKESKQKAKTDFNNKTLKLTLTIKLYIFKALCTDDTIQLTEPSLIFAKLSQTNSKHALYLIPLDIFFLFPRWKCHVFWFGFYLFSFGFWCLLFFVCFLLVFGWFVVVTVFGGFWYGCWWFVSVLVWFLYVLLGFCCLLVGCLLVFRLFCRVMFVGFCCFLIFSWFDIWKKTILIDFIVFCFVILRFGSLFWL